MDYQVLFNFSAALVAFLGGWWMNSVWRKISVLEKNDKELLNTVNNIQLLVTGDYVKKSDLTYQVDSLQTKIEKIESLELLVANHYVMKTDFSKSIDALFKKLDRIEDKLDSKADRS